MNLSRMLGKLHRAWSLARTRVLWGYRFYSLGARSVVGRCRQVTRTAAVSIGHHTTLCDNWTLADLRPGETARQAKIRIGSYCTILWDFQCNAASGVEIQDYVLVAPRVFITDSDHVVSAGTEHTTLCKDLESAPVIIEHDCWLGVNAVILKGVTVGHNSIIGANAVVTKDVPPFSTVVGVPARVVSRRSVTLPVGSYPGGL
jgi:carbonic anhydrase/acetyltransferase-like protein (isoleucine patch superfamily)